MDALRRLLTRPLLWALIYGGLIAYGIYALLHIPVEVLPRFNFPQISVVTHQPGATAEELETLIARPLEGRLLTLPDLVNVRSAIGHGTVQTDIRFASHTSPQQDLQAVNAAIDRAHRRLPPTAHPYAEIMGNAINEVADYTLKIPAGVAPVSALRQLRTTVVPALRALPGVQRVDVFGSGDETLWVQPDLQAMHRYGVAVTAITRALKDQVLLGPAGYVEQGHQDILIEARHLPVTAADLAQVPVDAPGGPIPLGRLARIVHAAEPTHNAVELDGHPAIALTVFKQPGASTLPVTRAVQSSLNATLDQLPPGVDWVRSYDQGHLVHLIGSDLGRNLAVGAVLAVAVLFWVLGAGRGIWTLALAVPLSLLLGVAGLYALGQSLDLMTLGALTVAVGLLADDSIIVLESIYHRWEQGDDHWGGIRQGLRDIAGPDVTGTLSTVAVFVPLLFVGGLAGLFFIPFAAAMSWALLASLLVSLSLIPLGLGFIGARPRARPTLGGRMLERARSLNERLLGRALRAPRMSLGVCGVLLVTAAAGLALVPINFLPLPNEGVILESFTLPPGSALTDTTQAALAITRRLRRDPAVAHTFARIGSAAATAYTEPAYGGEILITLKPGLAASTLDQVAARLLHKSRGTGLQVAVGTPTLERVGESLSGLPQPFVLRLFGDDIGQMRSLSKRVAKRLRHVSALTDVFNNDGYPVTQLRILPRPAALRARGLTPAELYAQLQPLLAGQVVAEVPHAGYPLRLYVRLRDAPHRSIDALRNLPIRTHGWTPLGQLADVKLATTPNLIRRINGGRALDILATPTTSLGRAAAAARHALADIHLPAGYRIAFGGLLPELEHAAVGVAVAALAAFILMLGILVLQFDGLLVPGLLLLQIPLAFTGGAAALAVSGVGLNATGLIAFLTLIGVSLNHGIVLLHRTRRNEAAGMDPESAAREAVHVRFRPIALTTLTATLGMLPTALGWGQGAAPEQGLAVVILGGILWSALLTTNLLPALYVHRRRKSVE